MSLNEEYILSLIAKESSEGLSDIEIRELELWRAESEENEKSYLEHRAALLLTERFRASKRVDMDAAWQKVKPKTAESRSGLSDFWKVAAVFIVLVGVVKLTDTLLSTGADDVPGGVTSVDMILAQTMAGEQKTIWLSDSSMVVLNENSSLRYASTFDSDQRNVELSGEAYFEVERDESRPFIIETPSSLVEVLGTSFNVKDLEGDSVAEVFVASGKVAFSGKEDEKNKKSAKKVVLEANDKAQLNKKHHELKKILERDLNALAWKTGKLIFEGDAMKKVIEDLSKFYSIQIKLGNPSFESCKLSASFENQPIEEVIEVIKLTYDLEVQQDSSTIVLIGKGC